MHPGASVYAGLRAVDKLTLAIIVDNETDGISSPCACCAAPAPASAGTTAPGAGAPACSYLSEFTRIAKGGELNFDRSCYAGAQPLAVLDLQRIDRAHLGALQHTLMCVIKCRRRSWPVHPVDRGGGRQAGGVIFGSLP